MPENYKKLKQVPIGQWFSVINKSGDDMTTEIKELIDSGEYTLELSNDYKRFKRHYDPFLTPQSDLNTKTVSVYHQKKIIDSRALK